MITLIRPLIPIILIAMTLVAGAQETACPPEPKEVEIVRRWDDSGESKIRLETHEDSSSVKSLHVKSRYERNGWFARIEGEAQLDGDARVEIATAKNLFGSARTFASWKHGSTDGAALETGLEMAIFGEDKLRLSHRLQPLSTNLEPRTELSFKHSLWGPNSIELIGVTQPERNEIGGEFLHQESSGFMWGASLTSRKASSQNSWEGAKVEGKLRWTW